MAMIGWANICRAEDLHSANRLLARERWDKVDKVDEVDKGDKVDDVDKGDKVDKVDKVDKEDKVRYLFKILFY